MRRLFLVTPLVLLMGCSSDDPSELPVTNPPIGETPPVISPNLAEARSLIEENFELWKYYQLQDYSFTVLQIMDIGCESSDGGDSTDHLPPVRVVVEDDEVKEIYFRDSPEIEVTTDGLPHLGTLTHMFNWTLAELDREPQYVSKWYDMDSREERPEFDKDFNFISSIFIKNKTDDDCLSVAFRANEFR